MSCTPLRADDKSKISGERQQIPVDNGPRRGGAMVLYAGDILNIDAETLTTVGDINGDVEDYPLPAPLPPQHAPEFTLQ